MISRLYKSNSLHSVFRRSQATIFAITLIICCFTFVSISTFTMETYTKQNLNILSLAVSERIQPAVVFRDQQTISQILNEYTSQHSIRSIEVFDNQNIQLANSTKSKAYYSRLQVLLDHVFLKDLKT